MTIAQIQHLLAYLGYMEDRDTGKKFQVDGIAGPQTEKAVRAFQEDYGGIKIDGKPGKETQKALRDAVAYNKFRSADTGTTTGSSGTFWDEIEYWSRDEFRCQCGGKYCNGFPAEPDETLVRLVNDLRKQAGRPAHRSSGLRCKTWNTIQGGVANSRHMRGKALDFFIEGVSGKKLLSMAQADPRTRYAYIIDGQYVHVDVL